MQTMYRNCQDLSDIVSLNLTFELTSVQLAKGTGKRHEKLKRNFVTVCIPHSINHARQSCFLFSDVYVYVNF